MVVWYTSTSRRPTHPFLKPGGCLRFCEPLEAMGKDQVARPQEGSVME
jgi:hypothetical protein